MNTSSTTIPTPICLKGSSSSSHECNHKSNRKFTHKSNRKFNHKFNHKIDGIPPDTGRDFECFIALAIQTTQQLGSKEMHVPRILMVISRAFRYEILP
mmetsp:Transcript_23441/g.51309  ORF Transcript_23441/g.51309 Transcript_23441/m.51309 type:complete len:98 (+) Transcript_23441:114-407(+)